MKEIRPNAQGFFPKLERPGVHDVALGNGTLMRIALMDTNRGLLVAACGACLRGAYEFSIMPDVGYVTEKFKLDRYPGDAANLTDFICDQLREGDADAFDTRHGHYNGRLLKAVP